MAISQQNSSATSFDVIVIGVGSMGSSACYFLAKRGHKVLGLEQFDIPHELGSHTGQTRIIRKAYFEHPDYVPLLNRAYENWKQFEDETRSQLYYQTGLVYFGKPGNELIKGVKLSASLYNIPLEGFDASSTLKRFSQFIIPGDYETLFEPEAGFIVPEKAIKLYADTAKKKGAEIHTNEKVLEWKKEEYSIVVVTNKNKYSCSKLIITAGPWSGKMIPGYNNTINVTRQVIAWIKPKDEKEFLLNNFSCWMIADDKKPGVYYGFPVLPSAEFGDHAGLKMAYHHPGIATDPDKVERQVLHEDMEELNYALKKFFPDFFESLVATKTCLYANSPDENFIIDRLPGYEANVVIACGFSGHGFKFIPVIGEILADLAIDGKTKHPIGFLNATRFGN